MKLIVTCGGQGTKLWPYSRQNKPKQFQKIIGNKSLLRLNLEALLSEFNPQDIYISTKEEYAPYIKSDAPEIPLGQVIFEPNFRKNQGPATIYSSLKIQQKYPEEPFVLVQADCIREPAKEFINMLYEEEKIIKTTKKLVTGGIRPQYPDMGSDYLRLGKKISQNVFEVSEFIMRLNDFEKTKELISEDNVLIHTNHYGWYPELLLDSLEIYKPDWFDAFTKMRDSFGKNNEKEVTSQIYENLEAGPIEIITKKVLPQNGAIIVLPFRWTDIGTWASVYEFFSKNNDVYADGEVLTIDSKNSLIKGPSKKLIAAIGLDNLVIVDTPDVLLVCPKNRSGDLSKILEKIKALDNLHHTL